MRRILKSTRTNITSEIKEQSDARYMLGEAEDVYHTNQDDALPDVRLRHVRDLGKDLVLP